MLSKLLAYCRKYPAEAALRAGALVCAALLLAALGQFARSGLLVRYWADDYCYSWVMRAGGLLRGPLDWYMASGNRFSTILIVGLQDLFGPAAIGLLPGAVLGLSALAWAACLRQAARLFSLALSPLWIAPFALAQVFFAALLAPDRLQTVYWRMGTLHYSLPLALLLLNLALAAAWLRAGVGPGRAALLFLLAVFAGGFSETFAALQFGAYALLLAGALLLVKTRRRWTGALLAALAGSAAAMLLELLSPSNAWRQAALPPTPAPLELAGLILRYTADFTRDTLRGMPVPLLALGLLSAGLAWAAYWRVRPSPPPLPKGEERSPVNTAQISRKSSSPPPSSAAAALAWVAACLAAGICLAACAIAPSAFAGGQFPAGRALMPARFALLAGWSLAAAALPGLLPAPLNRSAWAGSLAAVLILSAGLYPLRAAAALEPQRAQLAGWAQRWDERDAQIRAAAAAGQRDPRVAQAEVVSGLEDIGPDPGHWVNRCAAGYYQLNSITALP